MVPLNHQAIAQIRTAKRRLEVEVAEALQTHLERNYLLSFQTLARRGLDHMLSAPEADLNTQLAQKAASFLIFTHRRNGPNAAASAHGLWFLACQAQSLSLEDCSDIVRLTAEINEKFACFSADFKGQKGLRPVPTYSTPKAPFGNIAHRVRKDLDDPKPDPQPSPYRDIGPIARGSRRVELEPRSVIGAIDRAFGLPVEGADISGTTTDSIYVLGGKQIAAELHLLPIATMVPQGHHTILECAYPLTRHGYINYSVGFYETLNPAGGRAAGVLAQFDTPARNIHVLIWGTGAAEEGVQMVTPDEITEFKRMANVRSAYAYCVTGGLRSYPDALNITQTYSRSVLFPALSALKTNFTHGVFGPMLRGASAPLRARVGA